MNNTYYFWLIGFVGLGGAAIAAHLLKSDKRMLVTHVYLLYAAIFVGIFGYKSFDLRKDSNLALTKAENSQTVLKFTTAVIAGGRVIPMDQKSHTKLDEDTKKTFLSTLASLVSAKLEQNKPNPELDAQIIILKAEQRLPVKADINALSKDDPERAKLLKAVFQDKSVSKEEAESLKSLIDAKVPSGWYKEVFDLEWTKALGEKKNYEEKLEDFYEHYLWYIGRLLVFLAFLAVCGIAGLIIIFCQLFFLGRNSSSENETINEGVKWPWQSVAATLLTWLSLNFLLSPFAKELSASLMSGGEKSALTLATGSVCIYLIQNLPAILLVYFLAIRPGGIKMWSPEFRNSFRMQWKTQKRGPIGLVFMGVLAWMTCFPLVLVAAYFAAKFGSQVSSNPIISDVIAATKDMNPISILAFVFSLGIMPALVEEFLFRGFLFTSLRKYLGVFIALLLSAAIFSFVHMDQGSILQLFCLGFVFAFVFEKNHSLIPSMVAHCLWNLTTFTLILMLYS